MAKVREDNNTPTGELAVEAMESAGPTQQERIDARQAGQVARAEGNIALNDATPNSPLIGSNLMRQAAIREEDRKKKDQQLSVLKEARKILERIAQIDQQIDELQEERSELVSKIDIAQSALDKLERGENLELNADGELANQDYEDIIKEYERRTGKKVDRTDSESLNDIIHAMQGLYFGRLSEVDLEMHALQREQSMLSSDYEGLTGKPLSATTDAEIHEALELNSLKKENLMRQEALNPTSPETTGTGVTETVIDAAFNF